MYAVLEKMKNTSQYDDEARELFSEYFPQPVSYWSIIAEWVPVAFFWESYTISLP